MFAAGVNLQNFTAVYEGTFRPSQGGKYDLVIEGDDGYRVYVNGEKVIDYWASMPAKSENTPWMPRQGKIMILKSSTCRLRVRLC